MGTFTVPLQVADPESRHYETVEAVVDPGVTYTALPGSILERLGVVPHSARSFVLADGSRVERSFGRTWMRLNGREDISPVVFWDEGAQPLLGAVTLEIFGLGIDPVNGRLIPVDAFMIASGDGICRSTVATPGFERLCARAESVSLHDLLSKSPFNRLDLDVEGVRSPVREIDL